MDTLFVVYLICFGVGILFTLVSAFMADVFGGHEVGGGADLGAGLGHDGLGGVKPRVLAVFVVLVDDPAAPAAVLAAVRAPARERLERHFPQADVRTPHMARATVGALHAHGAY